MKRLFIPFMLMACLLMTACNNDDVIREEPEVRAIQFSQQDYSIMYGGWSYIGYFYGGGVYDVEVGNPEVIGRAVIDIETRRLWLFPIALGESTVTIKDVNMNQSVTINVTVANIHMYFHVSAVEGTNNNPYITQGDKIQLIRTCEDKKAIRIVGTDSHSTIAEGLFDMTKGKTEYTLEMSLHGSESEEPQQFRYSVKANDPIFSLYNQWFVHEYEPVFTNRASQQPQRLYMQLTDMSNGCKITTMLYQYNNYSIPVEAVAEGGQVEAE